MQASGPLPRLLLALLLALPLLVLGQTEEGIAVTDQLMLAKCAACHPVDERGNMQRISWERATPEGWEEALKRMIRANRVTLTGPEARAIVKYLSASHGLAPAESRPVMYYVERRFHDETGEANENLLDACAKCHAVGRVLSWRRSAAEWKEFSAAHLARYKLPLNEEAIKFLSKTAPLHSQEWSAWSAGTRIPDLTGRWLVTAHVPGRGMFYGEMAVQAGAEEGEFLTSLSLKGVTDGSSILRSGHSVVYAGYEWRGKSKGSGPPNGGPDDPGSEAREVMWFSPDGSTADGRWYWGQYQEFGFDVKMQRASSGPTLLSVDLPAMKIGSKSNHIRVLGDHFPARVKAADLSAGPDVKVRRVLSSTANEIVAEMEVAADAVAGKRDLVYGPSRLPGALAIYDRVDYVKVTPESSMAAFGSEGYPRGFQQFEAIGYQRGADGRVHTADDLELGPINANWSIEVFYEVDSSKRDLVASVTPSGFFTPAAESPKTNFDVWVIATAKSEKNKDGKPLVGKGYVVVTVPTYTFNGRKYVRDLDRWIEDGSATR
jgi:quinohemoprotein amine dehydrogenase